MTLQSDFFVLSQSHRAKNSTSSESSDLLTPQKSILLIAVTLALCTMAALLAAPTLDAQNEILIYLVGIAYIATRCPMRLAFASCVLSVLCFSYFVVPPIFSFAGNEQYLFTFGFMFLVAVFICRLINVQLIAKQQLRQQNEFLNLTSDAIIAWDASTQEILYWNDGAEKLFGYSKQEMLHCEIQSKLQAKYSRPLDELIVNTRNAGSWAGDISYRTRDDREITTASRWRYKSGDTENAIIVEFATDISAKKEAEKRVTEFYSTVSHELRTPLTIIRGNIELLRNGLVNPASSQAVGMFDIASEQCLKMTGLVNDILDLQKIEAGLLKLKIATHQINTVTKKVVNDFDNMARDKEICLTSYFADDLSVNIDSARIAQVITNYLSNAIKFSPKGSLIEVATAQCERGVRVSVKDNGPGIAETDIPKLFGKFQQIDSSDTRNFGGSGLGLAISKAIIEQHKGIVGVESKSGSGSEFWFEIPLCELPTNTLVKAAAK